MRFFKVISVVLSFILLSTGCFLQNGQQREPSIIDWENLQVTPKSNEYLCATVLPDDIKWEKLKQDFTYGLFGGIFPESISDTLKLAEGTSWINANEPQTLRLRLWYPDGNDRSTTLRLLIILDEQQLDNALPESGFYNDITLERGDDKSIKVTIPPLTSGIHDIVVIGIPYLEEYPNEYGVVNLTYWRITLIAEPASSPFRKIDFSSQTKEGSIKKNDPWMALEVTLQNNGIDVWNWPDPWLTLKPDTSLPFYALVGHEDVTNLDAPPMDELAESFFSLLVFVDYQQVEVAPDQMALYGRVDKDTAYARIPLEIHPLSEGKHYILVLSIDTPGVPVCILKGDPKGRILPNSVYGKLVGINVVTTEQ